MIPFAIYTTIGNELTNGVSSERDALAFAQEYANERGELVDVYQGSRKVATVKPEEEAAPEVEAWAWSLEGYWNTVIGSRTARELVEEFELDASDRQGLSEWLGKAETEAWRAGKHEGPLPAAWAGYHAAALDHIARKAAPQAPKVATQWRWNQSGAGAVHVSDGREGYWCDVIDVDAATVLEAFLRTADYDSACGWFTVTATVLRGRFAGDIAYREVCS